MNERPKHLECVCQKPYGLTVTIRLSPQAAENVWKVADLGQAPECFISWAVNEMLSQDLMAVAKRAIMESPEGVKRMPTTAEGWVAVIEEQIHRKADGDAA